jgi:hypothetical protein
MPISWGDSQWESDRKPLRVLGKAERSDLIEEASQGGWDLTFFKLLLGVLFFSIKGITTEIPWFFRKDLFS